VLNLRQRSRRRADEKLNRLQRGQFEGPSKQIGLLGSSDLSNGNVTRGFERHAPNDAGIEPDAFLDASNSEIRTEGRVYLRPEL
jgi:hypothetical protein